MESSAPAPAPAPANPQPLHNFDLPNLKWKTDVINSSSTSHVFNNRRRSVKSPPRDSVPESPIGGELQSSPIGDSLADPERLSSIRAEVKGTPVETKGTTTEESDATTGINKRSSKILIKIPRIAAATTTAAAKPEGGEKTPQDDEKIGQNNGDDEKIGQNNGDEINDEEMRIWNLRPRHPKRKPNDGNANTVDPVKAAEAKNNTNITGEVKKKDKKKLTISISLTKEEIEEDIYALTGLKPSRRPKRRPKNVQKKLDTLFPGQWLVSISPDSYKVSESSMKG